MVTSQDAKKNIQYRQAILLMIILFVVIQTAAADPGLGETNNQQPADNRIAALTNVIKALANNGVTAEEAIVTARIVNSHNKPPLSNQEVDAAVKSVYNKTSPSERDNKDQATVLQKMAGEPTAEQQEQQKEGLPSWAPKVLGLQFNGVYQNVPGFHSPYAGNNSFRTDGGRGHNITHIYGVYLGSQLASTLQAYLDIEMAKGSGVSKGVGLGGYPNGDVIRVGGADLGTGLYVARAYLRYFYPLSTETEKVERAMDQLPGNEPVGRIEIKTGRMSPSDDFDLNRYANNTRTQFLNYDLIYNPAWDEASDTRGYTYGFVAAMVQLKWRLAFGVYLMPTSSNGATFDTQIFKAQRSNLELTVKPNDAGMVIRVLTYLNRARMGSYDEALTTGLDTSSIPDVRADEKPGRTKYGVALNFEQPIIDDGETGIFGRIGWNDGHNGNFCYAEVDRHASVGFQVSGIHWGRTEDRVGVAYAVDGISKEHQNYLASGGIGLLLGDGKLSYGLEHVIETYYRVQIGKYVQVSPDFQYIQNPGYNRDRGPVAIYSLRVHLIC